MATAPTTTLSLHDLQIAVARLAIAQSQIGIAVLDILKSKSAALDETASQELFENVDTAVVDLQSLASEILGVP